MNPTTKTCTACGTPAQLTAAFCRNCGGRLNPATDLPPVRRLRRWRGRILLAVIIAAAVATTVTVWMRQNTSGAPDAPVRSWFTALAARDTSAAATLRPGLEVLRDDALRNPATYAPPTGLQIVRTTYAPTTDDQQRPNHSIAYVTVRYRINDAAVEQTIQVNRNGRGLNRTWSLGDGATGRLTIIGGALRRATIGPLTVPAAASADGVVADATVTLPPGNWTILAATDPLFTAPAVTATVTGRVRDQPAAMVTLTPTVKPAAIAAVDRLVRARVDDCAERTSLSLVDCPFDRTGGSYTGTVYSVRWTIHRYPIITLTPVDAPYPGGPVATLSTTTPGVARVTYAAYSTGGKTATETDDFTVDGDILLDGGELIWTGGKSGRLM